jgi:hypothetical protein
VEGVATTALDVRDLTRDPAELAASLSAWQRGDRLDAVAQTLQLATREIYARSYIAWLWLGRGPGGEAVWLVPVWSYDIERWGPLAGIRVFSRTICAACDAGADPERLSVFDWEGMTGLACPGADPTLAALALSDRHPAPARIAVASAPNDRALDGPPLELAPVDAAVGGVGALGMRLRTHPFRLTGALIAHGWDLDEHDYPVAMCEMLAHRGFLGPTTNSDQPSLAIRDDPCPKRRHARRVLRRLLHKRKVGPQYHTEFDNITHGIATDERAMSFEVAEALIRAGLLGEKVSVGQRHVYLRRESLPEIHALIERGASSSATLTALWTAPAPGE